MFSKFKNRLIPTVVFFLITCLYLTACSIGNDFSTQTEPAGQELNSTIPTTTMAAAKNQAEDIGNEKTVTVTDSDDDTISFVGNILAQIPDRDIYLYGEENGVTLRTGENEHYYEWPYMTPRGIEPRMSVADYDGDGKEELSVILYIGSGTGVSVEDLHIIEIYDEQENFKDYLFSPNSYIDQMDKALGFKMFTSEGELIADISTPAEVYTVSLKEFDNEDFGKIDEDLRYGSIVRFSEENGKLSVDFGVGVTYEFVPSACYFGNIFADVAYKDGAFELKNFRFEEI